MKLQEFIEKFVCPNTLVRLWYRCKRTEDCHHKMVEDNFLAMEWQILEEEKYTDHEVIGVKDILVRGNYSEAVNIVIKEK